MNQTKKELIIANMKLSNLLARAESRIRELEKAIEAKGGYIKLMEKKLGVHGPMDMLSKIASNATHLDPEAAAILKENLWDLV